jgi:DNA-binding beta-propeller fold protein YncE
MAGSDRGNSIIVGNDGFRYRVDAEWAQLPKGWSFFEVAGVAVGAQDRVYVLDRGEHPVIIFDSEGEYLDSWGEGLFSNPHSLQIADDGSIFCVDRGDHTVKRFTRDGKLLATWGNKDQASDTGAKGIDFRTITRGGPPFNAPTDLAFTPTGEFYVTDGYANARVHKFSADGDLLFSWGQPGIGPGEFKVPHSVCLDSHGRVFVADRENSRIQIFSPDGEFVSQWTGVNRPNGLSIDDKDYVYVAEMGYRYGLYPFMPPPSAKDPQPSVSIWSPQKEMIVRWGESDTIAPGNFCAPHMICLDSRGDIYTCELHYTSAARSGLIPMEYHTLQKFIRI